MSFLKRKGDLTIEQVIGMIILLMLLIALLIYTGILGKQSATLLESIMRFLTGR